MTYIIDADGSHEYFRPSSRNMAPESKSAIKHFFLTPTLLFNFLIGLSFSISLTVLSYISKVSWIPILFLVGIILWTLIEYLLNRFLLHGFSMQNTRLNLLRFHIQHHTYPENPKYLVIHPGILFIVTALLGLIGWITFEYTLFPILGGFFFGYCLFIVMHFTQHYSRFQLDHIFYNLWKSHFLHHTHYHDKAFGVTTTWWDIIFRTSPPMHYLLEVDPSLIKGAKKYKVIEVQDSIYEQAFLEVPEIIYQNNPFWIPPLQSEIRNIFDPAFNPYYKHGTAKRWIIVNEYQEVLGRIAAFIDFEKMYDSEKKIGCIGFFECVEDEEAAQLLLDTALNWLKVYYKVDAVDGPVNFGENDKYWGLLVDGFKYPSYGMNFNPPYYKDLFEKYGFEKQYEQLTNLVDLKKNLPERFVKITERVCRNERYTFEHFRFKEKDKYIKDFVNIYNQAWASFKNFRPMSEEYIDKSLEQIKPVVVESFIWFAYVEGKPAGLLVGLPDLNEALKNLGGKFNLWSKIKFLFFKYCKGFTKARVIIMGISPEFQRLGLESALIYQAFKAGMKKPNFKYVQLAWVGDFNKKMIAIHQAMGAIPETRHTTYRKFLN